LLSPDPEEPRFGSLYERNSSSSEASLDLYSPAAGVVIGRGSWFGRENPTRKSLRDLRCPAPLGGRPDADGTCCSEPPGDGGERGTAAPAAGPVEYGSGAKESTEKSGDFGSDRARFDPAPTAGASVVGRLW